MKGNTAAGRRTRRDADWDWDGFVVGLILIIVVLLYITTGCSQNLYNLQAPPPLEIPVEKFAPPAGTIWPGTNSGNAIFADKKARYVNDIVTITVSEYTTGANNAKTTTSRDSTATAGIAGLTQTSPDLRMLAKYELGGSASNAMKGDGQTSRNSNLTGTITARVIRVLDNGNLLIEGRRQLTVNAEDQYLILTGIIRTEDISSENVIASSYISDAKITYAGKGIVDDKVRPGWLTRVLDWVWPF